MKKIISKRNSFTNYRKSMMDVSWRITYLLGFLREGISIFPYI